MLNLKLFRENGDSKDIKLYSSVEEIVYGMNVCLDRLEEIRRFTKGLQFDAFQRDRPIQDRCAMDFQIIGNQIGRLDPALQFNDAMQKVYRARSVIAHVYGTKDFKLFQFWNDFNNALDDLEQGCRKVLEEVQNQEVTFYNLKSRNRFFR